MSTGVKSKDAPHGLEPSRLDGTAAANPSPVDISILLPSLTGGGMERVRLLLAKEFMRRGHTVELVVLSASGELVDQVGENLPIVDLATPRYRGSLWPIARYLREHRPRALLVGLWPLTSIAIAARFLSGVPTRVVLSDHVDWSQSLEASSAWRTLILRLSSFLTYRLADGLVGISDGVIKSVSRYSGLPTSRFRRVHNPPTLAQEPGAQDLPPSWPPGEGPKLITAGRLVEQKDHATLLQALARVREHVPARLVILGAGPLHEKLVALSELLGLSDAVALPGFDPYPARWLREADLFVLASRFEGFGNVVVEALSCGVPVVSTDCPTGPAEILDGGRYGTLCRVGDAEGLATAIESALLTPADHEALIARSRAYTLEAPVRQYLELLLPDAKAAA
jgi:glycosyltransferase involved in cell wall biosynthesis